MSSSIEDVKLNDLQMLTETLVSQMKEAQFKPDVVIYLETGARLIGACFYKATQVPVIPITIQRPNSSSKARITTLFINMPVFLQNFLRKVERRVLSFTPNPRTISAAPQVNLVGKKVLILDDAADSGESLLLAKKWAMEKNAIEENIRLATIAVTQLRAKQIVDFWIYPRICRFPWSSDSRERVEYLKQYEQTDPAKFTIGHL